MAQRPEPQTSVPLEEVLSASHPLPFPQIADAPMLTRSGRTVWIDWGLRILWPHGMSNSIADWASARTHYQQGHLLMGPIHVQFESGACANIDPQTLRVPVRYLASSALGPDDLPGRVITKTGGTEQGCPAEIVPFIACGNSYLQLPEENGRARGYHGSFPAAKEYFFATDDELAALAARRDRFSAVANAIAAWWERQPTLAAACQGLPATRAPITSRELPGLVVRPDRGFARLVPLYQVAGDVAAVHDQERWTWHNDETQAMPTDQLHVATPAALLELSVLLDERLVIIRQLKAWWQRPTLDVVLTQLRSRRSTARIGEAQRAVA